MRGLCLKGRGPSTSSNSKLIGECGRRFTFRSLQSGPLGQEMFHGRRVPPCATARRPFVHRLKLHGDLLQRAIGRRGFDAGHQPDQSVVNGLWTRAAQQVRLDHAFRHQSPDGAAQSFNGPGRTIATVQDPHDVAPGLVWPHTLNCGQPGFKLLKNTVEVRGGAAGSDFADRISVTGAQTRVSANPTARPRRFQASLGALGDQGAFELRDRAKHLQREHPLRCGSIDGIVQAAEMRAIGLELLDDREQVADRAGEPVEPDHDQGFARADLAEQTRQYRSASISPGRVPFQHRFAARGTKFVELRIGALLLGGDARVSPRGGREGWISGVSSALRDSLLSRMALLQFNRSSVNDRLNRWPGALRDCREQDRRRGGEGPRRGPSRGSGRLIGAFPALSVLLQREFRSVRPSQAGPSGAAGARFCPTSHHRCH
jgi:hypothetical protein